MFVISLEGGYEEVGAYDGELRPKEQFQLDQGSCLGPILFLVYINDLPFCLNKGKVTMYADDTAISHSSSCLSKLQDDLNQDLVNLQNWLHAVAEPGEGMRG